MNTEIAAGKWTELKGDIQAMWGKLTHDELDRTKGNITAIAGIIQQRYGEKKEAVVEKLRHLMGDGAKDVADKSQAARDAMRASSKPNGNVNRDSMT